MPPGVPPLALTGERTLPDVPAENYWFRRHLAVYKWIAPRCAGLRVLDMACGEGYGAAVLARAARHVTGVEANPEAFEHARLRYTRPGLDFARDAVERYAERADAVVFLQTIEHVPDPHAVLEHLGGLVPSRGAVYVSTPNVLTLAPAGAERSDNPWHLREYRLDEFRALCRAHFGSVEVLGLVHARRLRVHDVALRLGWDSLHRRLGLTRAFYDAWVPRIGSRDFRLRAASRRGRELDGSLDFLAVCRRGRGST
jgi:SAM-dependent methyltransferase